MKTKQMAAITAGVLVLMLATAGASVYITQEMAKPDKSFAETTVKHEQISWNDPKPAPAPAQATDCNDHNVVGKIGGGVVGGILGSKVGDGDGKTAATIGGTLGGSYVGGKYLPTQNVTCK